MIFKNKCIEVNIFIGTCDYDLRPYNVTFFPGMISTNFTIDINDDEFKGIKSFELFIDLISLPYGVKYDNKNPEVSINEERKKLRYAISVDVLVLLDFIAITVNFSQSVYKIFEHEGSVQPVLIISEASECCLQLSVEVMSITATGELCT